MVGDLLEARISARTPPSCNGPPSENAGSRSRDDRTQPALARLGERESRAECPSRVRAEVWVEGRKVGDTPLANLQLTLGVREITFRHPQLGERRVTVTVKGNGPVAVSIDMTKP